MEYLLPPKTQWGTPSAPWDRTAERVLASPGGGGSVPFVFHARRLSCSRIWMNFFPKKKSDGAPNFRDITNPQRTNLMKFTILLRIIPCPCNCCEANYKRLCLTVYGILQDILGFTYMLDCILRSWPPSCSYLLPESNLSEHFVLISESLVQFSELKKINPPDNSYGFSIF